MRSEIGTSDHIGHQGGRGIGRAIALALAREGAAVAVTARTAEVMDVAAEIERGDGRALALMGDVSRASDVNRVVAQTLEAINVAYELAQAKSKA